MSAKATRLLELGYTIRLERSDGLILATATQPQGLRSYRVVRRGVGWTIGEALRALEYAAVEEIKD
jgi:hypothetical protein